MNRLQSDLKLSQITCQGKDDQLDIFLSQIEEYKDAIKRIKLEAAAKEAEGKQNILLTPFKN